MVQIEQRQPELRILGNNKNVPRQVEAENTNIVDENPARSRYVDTLPDLVEGEGRIKANPFSGVLYIATYRPTNLIGENGWPVVKRRHSRYIDIDVATRGIGNIVDKYDKDDGQEVGNTKTVVRTMQNLLDEFRSGNVTKERLEEISLETVKQLEDSKFQGSGKSQKQQLVRQLTLATQPDKLGRVNPLVSRSRIASAWLKTTRELFVAKLVRDKFSYLYTKLANERDMERFFLQQATKHIDDVIEGGGNDKELAHSLEFLQDYLKTYLSPQTIKANPYRGPAIEVGAILFGVDHRGQEGKMIRRYLGNEKAEIVFEQTPIQRIVADETRPIYDRWEETSRRLRAARNMLSGTLLFGEENLRPKDESEEDATISLKVPA